MKFTTPPNKDYRQDLIILHDAIKNEERISFSKFCDGEWAVIQNQGINNKEFWFDPNNEKDKNKRQQLIEAFQYKNDRYFVGVTCVGVFGLETHKSMKSLSGQKEDHLTWADIWVNSNYRYYLQKIVPLFSNRTVVLFCNENGNVDNLPFKPYIVYPLKNNSWEYNWNAIDDAKSIIDKLKNDNIDNVLFLFCCGPFGNILCHQLTDYGPQNTYLDIGSTLNPFLQSEGFKRDYYVGDNYFSRMIGCWE